MYKKINHIDSINSRIEKKVAEYRQANKKSLTILFIKKHVNIKDINDMVYDIYFEIDNDIQYFQTKEYIECEMYIKTKQEVLKDNLNIKEDNCIGYILKLKLKKKKVGFCYLF